MPIPQQSVRQRVANQPVTTDQQHRPARRPVTALRRALVSGTWASLVSTAVISCFSRRRNRATAAGTNATSQWVWGREAHRRDGWSLRHTALGYVIHHACSIFWASGYEWVRKGRRKPSPVLPLAVATSVLAYVVDYKVVHPRLSPGFDQRMKDRDMFFVYAAFGIGLVVPWLARRRVRDKGSRRGR